METKYLTASFYFQDGLCYYLRLVSSVDFFLLQRGHGTNSKDICVHCRSDDGFLDGKLNDESTITVMWVVR
jgi:hypothetical protein